jgi:hypothetical protein
MTNSEDTLVIQVPKWSGSEKIFFNQPRYRNTVVVQSLEAGAIRTCYTVNEEPSIQAKAPMLASYAATQWSPIVLGTAGASSGESADKCSSKANAQAVEDVPAVSPSIIYSRESIQTPTYSPIAGQYAFKTIDVTLERPQPPAAAQLQWAQYEPVPFGVSTASGCTVTSPSALLRTAPPVSDEVTHKVDQYINSCNEHVRAVSEYRRVREATIDDRLSYVSRRVDEIADRLEKPMSLQKKIGIAVLLAILSASAARYWISKYEQWNDPLYAQHQKSDDLVDKIGEILEGKK